MKDPITGAWLGLGLGDDDPEIARFKEFLLRKFGWVRDWSPALGETALFDANTADVVRELQARYDMEATGVVNYALKTRSGFIKPPPPPSTKGTLFTVQGTGVDMWTGPPADTARAVADDWYHQPVGNYPATPFPMWASIWQGITELRFLLRRFADTNPDGLIALAGYSQGACVTSWVYKWDILLPPNTHPDIPGGGILHDIKDRVVAGVTWGNPYAELGTFNGNRYAGWPVPEGRGINRDRLENTPAHWLDFGHGRNSPWGQDIYCDTPNDPAGDMMTVICDIVMQQEMGRGFFGLLDEAGKLLADPGGQIPYLIDAVMSAGMFFIAERTMPHLNYDIGPAVDYLRGVAASARTRPAVLAA